jgi:hypothetical protein
MITYVNAILSAAVLVVQFLILFQGFSVHRSMWLLGQSSKALSDVVLNQTRTISMLIERVVQLEERVVALEKERDARLQS